MTTATGAQIKPFTIYTEQRRNMFGKLTKTFRAYLTGAYGETVYDVDSPMSAADARESLLKQVAAVAESSGPTVIFCGDGLTVLVVYRRLAGWAYEITDHKRSTSCACFMNCETRKQAVQQAVNHADQSYNGTINVLHC